MSRKPRINSWETRCVESLLVKSLIFILGVYDGLFFCCPDSVTARSSGTQEVQKWSSAVCPMSPSSSSTLYIRIKLLVAQTLTSVCTWRLHPLLRLCPVPIHPSLRPASVHLKSWNTLQTVQRASGVRSRRHAVHGGEHIQRQLYQGVFLHACLGSGGLRKISVSGPPPPLAYIGVGGFVSDFGCSG